MRKGILVHLSFILLFCATNTFAQKSRELNIKGDNASYRRDYRAALELYSQGIEADPTDVENYKDRALVKYMLKDWEGASNDYDMAASKTFDANNASLFLFQSADCRYKMLDFKGCVERCDKLLESDLSNKNGFYLRGISKSKLEDTQGKCEDLRRALELEHPKAREALKRYCGE